MYTPEPMYTISFLFRRILVPFDGSEHSKRALEVAIDFAKRYGSKITVLYVQETPEAGKGIEDYVRRLAERSGVELELKIRKPNPYSSVANEVIREVTEGGYDIVIMGARGNTLNEDLLIGSVALALIVNAPVSVMVVR
ncbi:MAG: universal stress protein [Crenarchaeota archaeon]|nr:universal stress protein [Thermoproteota archaeon]